MAIRIFAAGGEDLPDGAPGARAAWAPFFKRLLGAVLASAAMFHGPDFSSDPRA